MQDLYETEYGIYNHLGSSGMRPLSSVAMFPSEDVNTNSRLEEMMRTYLKKGIYESYGLSFIEFMDLPIDIVEMLINVSDEHRSKQPPLPDFSDIGKEK